MPIPQRNKNERKEAFIDRCMSDDTMGKEYPISQQRYAVCVAQLSGTFKPYGEVKLQSFTDYPKAASENAKAALRYAEQYG